MQSKQTTDLDRRILNQMRLDNPKPGDYWHERFAPNLAVLHVLAGGNLVIVDVVVRKEGVNMFDVTQAKEITQAQLAGRVLYTQSKDFLSDVVIDKCKGYVRDWIATKGAYIPLDIHFPTVEVITDMRPSEELDQRGFNDPQPGDYWSDHMVAQVLVLKALSSGNVVVVTDVKRDDKGQLFLLEKAREIDKDEFAKVTCRNTNGGHGCSMLTGSRAAHALLEIWKNDFNSGYAKYQPPMEPSPTELAIREALKQPTLAKALTKIVEHEAETSRQRPIQHPNFADRISAVLARYEKGDGT